MKERGINNSLVTAFSNMLRTTSMLVDGKAVDTNTGVMQGAVTSPITFALYIDDLLRLLNQTSKTYALADDLVCICKGDMQLFRTVKNLNKMCKNLGLSIN